MRAAAWKEYYKFKEGCLLATNIVRINGEVLYSRDLDYGFAQTVHKSQGSTYDNVFVDLYDMIYNKNNRIYTNTQELLRRLYVACSRAKKKLILCYNKYD